MIAEWLGGAGQPQGRVEMWPALRPATAFLDGTKMAANAALSASYGLEHINKILEEAQAVDQAEGQAFGDSQGDDRLPEELANARQRIKRIQEAKKRLDDELKRKQAEQAQKVKEHEQSGSKRGRRLKAPDEVSLEKKANVTDPDSRIMKDRKGFVQGYNCQAVVTKNQIIVAPAVTQDENDLYQLEPMLQQSRSCLRESGLDPAVETVAAAAGYFRDDLDIEALENDRMQLLICTHKSHKLRRELKQRVCPKGLIPENLTARERMNRRLLTKRGYAIYKKRSHTVEPIFGQIKKGLNLERFLRRGLNAATSEWTLVCTISNLMKLFRHTVPA